MAEEPYRGICIIRGAGDPMFEGMIAHGLGLIVIPENHVPEFFDIRETAKYINAPIANPVVLRRMSSISEQWSENGSCDISMSSEKAVPASKVFGKLFNFLKQTGQTIPTGMNMVMFPTIFTFHPSYLSQINVKGFMFVQNGKTLFLSKVRVPMCPST